ncbi:NAD-dependent DNA ligase LigA [Candidatus Shikimatogenerans silvanidophilus]|uniref:NAD-dependent DNA ligase LigA n=1 Tax=Candidatus Shikimatogenerans silvanidophilus TaxID=2782547 RepID=UPI001BA917B7|nr:NAD-dependent DNA ligase LigA [Candidatus Shikimatogenerans silvanidophilus]
MKIKKIKELIFYIKIKKLIISIKKEIKNHNYKYYYLNDPDISNFEFDKKLKFLEKLEKIINYKNNSPTIDIGNFIFNNRKKNRHDYKMYSLKNAYSFKEIKNWEKSIKKKINKFSYTCELKYDGISINLIYNNGKLKDAITRGNGIIGNSVINNIINIPYIPKFIKNKTKNLNFFGEIILPISSFEKINNERIKKNKKPYSHPRNTVSGTIMMKDYKIVKKRKLSCFIYSINGIKNGKSHFELLNLAKKLGFNVPNHTIKCYKLKNVFNFIEYWEKNRFYLPYIIDGIVIKIDELHFQKKLGYTSKFPKWSIAFKFNSKKNFTKILDIEYKVGKMGIITPIAKVLPIIISGTKISKVSLYNKKNIDNLNIFFNDTIIIEKRGEIIPKIVGIDLNKRNPKEKNINFIKKCPSCKKKLLKINSLIYCLNKWNCIDQIIEKIFHFSKNMNIYLLGKKNIEILCKNNLLNNVYDLYNLYKKKEKLLNIINKNEFFLKKLFFYIENSKNQPFEKVLYSLCIKGIGIESSKKIVNCFEKIENILFFLKKKIPTYFLKKIGKKNCKNIIEFLSEKKNLNIIQKLKKIGLKFKK